MRFAEFCGSTNFLTTFDNFHEYLISKGLVSEEGEEAEWNLKIFRYSDIRIYEYIDFYLKDKKM